MLNRRKFYSLYKHEDIFVRGVGQISNFMPQNCCPFFAPFDNFSMGGGGTSVVASLPHPKVTMLMPKIPTTAPPSGAWMERELYTIASVGSGVDDSVTTAESSTRAKIRRCESNGESSVSLAYSTRSGESSADDDDSAISIGDSRTEDLASILGKASSSDEDVGGSDRYLSESSENVGGDRYFSESCEDIAGHHYLSDGDAPLTPKSTLGAASKSFDVESLTSSNSTDCTSLHSQDDLVVVRMKSERTLRTSNSTSPPAVLEETVVEEFSEEANSDEHTTYTSDASTEYYSQATGASIKFKLNPRHDEESGFPLTLENVEYMSHFDLASHDNDLSTIDDPLSPDMVRSLFVNPTPLPRDVPLGAQDDVSTLYSRVNIDKALVNDNLTIVGYEESKRRARVQAGAEPSTDTVTTTPTRIMQTIHSILDERSTMEIFFMCLITVSTITLVVIVLVATL